MKKHFLLVVLVSLFYLGAQGQKIIEGHWGKPYLDIAYAVAASNDGGYILTGLTKSGINDQEGDIFIIKLNSTGDTSWTQVYGGPMLEGGNSVIQTADGGFMVSGHTEDFGAIDCDAFLLKIDKNGNHQWMRTYGGQFDDISEQVLQLSDGSYIMAGITASFGNGGLNTNRHIYYIRTTATGDTLWTKYYASSGAEYAYSIAQMNGGYLSVGFSTGFGHGEHDAWLLQLNENGDTVRTRLYQNPGDSRFYQILPTMDNGFILSGFTTITPTCKPQGFVVKLDARGNELWKKTYGDTVTGIILHAAAELPNGNLMFTGVNYGADIAGNVYIMNTDPNGNKTTDDICGGTASMADCIAIQGNNGYLVAGTTAKYGDHYGDAYYIGQNNNNAGVPTQTVLLSQLYPDPVKDKAIVILPEAEAYQEMRIEVFNVAGQKIWSRQNVMGKDMVIDTYGFSAGMYIFSIMSNDGKTFKGKFAVE